MAQLPVKKLRRQLLRKGFQKKTGKQHHTTYLLHINGRKTDISVFWSHGDKEIPESLQAWIRRDMCLTRMQFDSFIDCSLSKRDYALLMEERGLGW